jgi:hypothetical protein
MIVTLAFVFAVWHAMPNECTLYPGHLRDCDYQEHPGFDRGGRDLMLIASAIAKYAETPREAVRMAVYSAYESGNHLSILGDHNSVTGEWKSHGAWQTPNTGKVRTAEEQLKAWMAIRDASLSACGDLTALASGTCGLAQKHVDRREALIDRITAELTDAD